MTTHQQKSGLPFYIYHLAWYWSIDQIQHEFWLFITEKVYEAHAAAFPLFGTLKTQKNRKLYFRRLALEQMCCRITSKRLIVARKSKVGIYVPIFFFQTNVFFSNQLNDYVYDNTYTPCVGLTWSYDFLSRFKHISWHKTDLIMRLIPCEQSLWREMH